MQLNATVLAVLALLLTCSAQDASKPRTERISVPSAAVDGDVTVAVHLPGGYDTQAARRYPVIFFLHGAGRGSERTWAQRGTNETVAKLVDQEKLPPCIIVCPRDAGRMSFYINWKGQQTQRHGDFITAELPAYIDEKYRTLKGRPFRALMGDSMGGFGALVNALRHPDVFGTVSAHEPAIYPEEIESLPGWIRRGGRGRGSILSRLFGEPLDEKYWLEHNVFHIAKTAKKGAFKDLPIYFDVGENDRYGLDQTCPPWSKLLKEKGIKHSFHLRPGGHGSRFFADAVPSSLEFHGRHFQAALKKAAATNGK